MQRDEEQEDDMIRAPGESVIREEIYRI